MINVVSKRCEYENCKKMPSFNYPDKTNKIYCFKHKLEGMINVKNDKCKYKNCKIVANFNYYGNKNALYCAKHKLDNMVDIRHQKCKNELCFTRAIKKYDDYCAYCFMNMFPDRPNSLNYKTKEKNVTDYIKNEFNNFDWVCDKRVNDGCSKRRPDLLLDLGYQVIIIEIDENQHNTYVCTCENKRIMELSQDVNHRPIIFIRFNPDSYIASNGKLVNSCWKINNNDGLCRLKKDKKKEWNFRLNSLKEQITYWTNPENITDKTIEVVQLFYDM